MALPKVSGGSSGGGGTEKYTFWDIDCDDKRVRVFVNNLEIPTTFVETHESRDGPASYNQLTEIRFPEEWEDESVAQYIDAFDPDNYEGYDRVLIQRQNTESGEWMDHQYGFVRNVGGTDERGVLAMWVADPSMLTTGIEYGKDFQNATGDDILRHLQSTFNSETVFTIDNVVLPEGGLERDESTSDVATSVFSSSAVDATAGGNEHLFHPSFKSNRDTLKDAFDWVAEKSDTDWWFDYLDENLILYFGERETTTWTSDHVDAVPSNGSFPGPLREINIISNEALTEITPVNTVQVGGVTGRSVLGHNIKQLSSEYPYARAEYPPLVERAGQYVSGPMQNVDASTLEEAENVAKQLLRDEILGSGHGEIKVFGTPEMNVGDEIHAIPECADKYIADVKPFTFQITDLTHTKKALEEYVTEATVSPRVNEDLIEITESRMKDQQTQ